MATKKFLPALLFLIFLSTPSFAARCGDVDGNGSLNITDYVYLWRYVFDGPAPNPLWTGDVNGSNAINLSDVVYLLDYIFYLGDPPHCGSPGEKVSDNAGLQGNIVKIGAPPYDFYPDSDSAAIPIYISNSVDLGGLTIGLTYETSANNDITSINTEGSILPALVALETEFNTAGDTLLIGWNLYYNLALLDTLYSQSNGLLCFLNIQTSPEQRIISIEFDSCFVPPAGEFIFASVNGGGIAPEFIDESGGSSICGDANNDGISNVSDAVYIINYVFAGGNPPNPLASGDANCDGVSNVSDAVWIINYVFAGGHFPCDLTGDGIPDC